MKASNTRYTYPAIGLHWLMAFMIVCSFCVGVYMSDLPRSVLKLKLYSWHKWAGITILWLAFFRLAWRVSHKPPALPDVMPKWQRQMATGLHHVLYLLIFAIPLSGWLMSSAKGFQVVYFGKWALPNLVAKDAALGDLLENVHASLNYTMIVLVIGHAAAAIRHHFVDKDDVLIRMLPFLKQRNSSNTVDLKGDMK